MWLAAYSALATVIYGGVAVALPPLAGVFGALYVVALVVPACVHARARSRNRFWRS